MKLEHIDNLSKWKKSWCNIWSRKISHRLRNYEREIYERSLKKWYLEVDFKDRVNLQNLWEKVSQAKWWDNIIFIKDKEQTKIIKNWSIIFIGTLSEWKNFIKNNY
jgi:hypothetical protein